MYLSGVVQVARRCEDEAEAAEAAVALTTAQRRAEGLTVLNARLAAQASESKRERDSEAKSAGSAMGDGGGVEI